jgi:hypothetical protein
MGQAERDRQNGTGRTEQVEQDSQDRTARKGLLAKKCLYRTARIRYSR